MKRFALIIAFILLGFTSRAQSMPYFCRYWFDQNYEQAVVANFSDSIWQAELDVGSLEEGLHTLILQVCDTSLVWNRPQAYMFYKVDTQFDVIYHCWFDQDIEHYQTNALGDGQLLLDVAELSEGLHTVNIMLDGNAPQSYMFLKIAMQGPSTVQYHYWFDNDNSIVQTGFVGAGIVELEVGDLSNGLHTVYVQLDNGTLSVPQSYLFYKRPVGGNIVKWEYWLNGDVNNRHTTNLSPGVDTLDIIALLPLETCPIRSTCFHFHPNGDEPYINAKNEITFSFWDAEYHVIYKSSMYVAENVFETIIADTLVRDTTVIMAAPRDNQIRWFKLAANRGDYLAFQADKACSMQLFAPSGEEVYNASGPESIQETSFNVWENGVYYLAVHDVTGSGDTVSITYNWIYRYSLASYDVHLVGNGGFSTITFQGNGFNSLLDAYLVNAQNDTIRQLDIGHESNTTTTVSFNFYQENLGVYDAVFEFYEETIRINGALEVQEPVDIYLTSTVSYPTSFMSGTTVTYDFTITNNGNMSAYVVPLYLYIASPTPESITHLEIEGLNLPTLADYMNLDSLSADDVEIIREWAKAKGDDHYFNFFSSVENNMGNNVAVRTNFFFVNLAPFESKNIKVKITATTGAHQPIEVWMTVPNEVIPPYIGNSYRDAGKFCCVMNHIECYLSIMSNEANVRALFLDAFAIVDPEAIPMAVLMTIASCTVSVLNALATFLESSICNDEQGFLNKVLWPFNRSAWSLVGMSLSCLPSVHTTIEIPSFKDLSFRQILKIINDIADSILKDANALAAGIIDDQSCAFDNCFSGIIIGGQTDGRTPKDPNDIYGYLSESGSHYMRQEIQNIHYEIEFENDTTLATAAAHTIIVRDTLDASKFDLNSLAAHSVTIGDKRLELNGEQTFARTLDLRPELYVIAQINQDYDPTTGIVEWIIQSLDPMTMEPTDDPNQGVLPVNYFGNGVGFIDYSVNLLQAFDDGTAISNRAGIIFDQEELIMTPIWTNIVDAVRPTSHIEEVTVEADSLNFSFVSSDSRSGVWCHTLYYRNDSTAMEWQVKKAQIFENSYKLCFDEYQTTEYLVMAVDSAGNVEEKNMVAEYVYIADSTGTIIQTSTFANGWNWWSSYVEADDLMAQLKTGLGADGKQIKSQTKFTMNYGTTWMGQLTSIENDQTYMVQTLSPCSVDVTGFAVNPADHPITLNTGWKWIGFPSAETLTVTEALAGLTPTAGDQIKAQSSFSTYYNNLGWIGTLKNLTPGKGYMFKLNGASQTLVFPSGSRNMEVEENTADGNHWVPDIHAYPSNMTVMAVVELDDVELASENYELAAFANGDVRGSARLMFVEGLNRWMAFLTIAGDETAELCFGLYDSETGMVETQNFASLQYETDAIVGTPDAPFVVRFRGTIGLNEWADRIQVFPNPVERGQNISLNLPDEGKTQVEIVNELGVVTRRATSVQSPASIEAPSVPGVYTMKITMEGKGMCYRKLVVE